MSLKDPKLSKTLKIVGGRPLGGEADTKTGRIFICESTKVVNVKMLYIM